jgi:hypothetical protein
MPQFFMLQAVAFHSIFVASQSVHLLYNWHRSVSSSWLQTKLNSFLIWLYIIQMLSQRNIICLPFVNIVITNKICATK